MARTRRTIARVALGLAAAVVVAAGAALIALHTDWGRERVRARLEARLAEAFTGGATIGALGGSPLGELALRDVVIRGPAGEPAITARVVRIRLALLPLLSKELRLRSVIAEDVEVRLDRDERGELELARLLAPRPAPGEPGWSVELRDVRVHRGHVSYDAGRGERVNLDDLELRAEARVPAEGPLAATVELTGRWRERALPIELGAAVRAGGVSGEALAIERASARAGDLELTAEDVRIGEAPGGGPAIEGALTVRAPRAAVARLGLGLELPADVSARLSAAPVPSSPWTRVELAGTLGETPVTARVRADLGARRVAGYVATGALDWAALSAGRIEGSASTFASFDAALPAGRALPVGAALVHAWGTLEGAPEAGVRVALSSTGERASAIVDVAGRALRAHAAAELSRRGRAITLHRGTLTAQLDDPHRATGGALPVRGALRAELTARGALAPAPSLAIAGTIDGRRLRIRELPIASLELAIDARVTPGEVVTVELERHRVRAGGGDWRGTTGRLAISPARIELRELRTRSAGGALAIAGTYHRAGPRAGDVEARVDAKTFTLDNLDPRYRGAISGRLELERRGGRLAGRAALTGRGVAIDPTGLRPAPRAEPVGSPPHDSRSLIDPGVTPVDADARLALRGGRLTVDASARGPRLGRIELAAELDAPRDPASVRAWQALGRGAIRSGRLALERVDARRLAALAGLPGEHRGVIDGELRLSPTTASGELIVRDLVTPSTRELGPIDAELRLGQTARGELAPALTARIGELGELEARGAIAVPARPFDPQAWRRLGRDAVASAELRTGELAFDPAVLARLGVPADLRGRASLSVELEEGGRVARISARVRGLRGPPLTAPVFVELDATAGDRATTFRLVAGTAAVRLVEADGRIARSFAQLRADPRAALDAPLTATARIPAAPAGRVLAVFGRREVIGGTISGSAELAGTVAAPTGRARVTAAGIALRPGPFGRRVKPLERVALDVRWDGAAGSIELIGAQPGGSLHVVAQGRPAAPGDATLTLRATRFELAPLLVFVPGAIGASAGRLDAELAVTGLDPRTARLAGELHLAGARLPIAPSIGTLRRARLDLVAGARELRLALDGRLGGGAVKAAGTIALEGAAPTGGTLTLALRDVAPIGGVEPEVDADVTARLAKGADRWIAEVEVANGAVRVPSDRGEPLKPVGAPDDMVFVNGEGPAARRARAAAPPDRPLLEARVRIGPTYLESEEVRGVARGRLTITAAADAIGLVGVIEAERGDLDLFGRRYVVERAAARFDGSTDPVLDVAITYDFPDVTTITEVRGRLSAPELVMSSSPAIYSQGQLLGFLLGGEPNGQIATGSPREQVTAAGASLVANRLAGYVRRALPIDLDVLRYEAATASTSAAFTVGTWLTRSLFVAYRRRLEARPDENASEAEISYWISRRLMLEGVLGDRGVSGLDLLWRKRY